MVKLRCRHTTVDIDPLRKTSKAVEVLVAEASELAGETSPYFLDVSGAGHRETETTRGAHGEPAALIGAQGAVVIALLVGQRGEHEPVRHRWSMHEIDGVERCCHICIHDAIVAVDLPSTRIGSDIAVPRTPAIGSEHAC